MPFDPAALIPRLPELFRDPDMFASRSRWQAAGFEVSGEGDWSAVMVASHPVVPDCLFKKYRDKISPKDQLKNYRARVEGADELREFVAARGFSSVVAPRKFVHELPPAFARDKRPSHVLVVERFSLAGRSESKDMFRAMSEGTLRELCAVLLVFRGLDSGARNVPFTTGGKIAFVDTERWSEHRAKEDFLRRIRRYLSDDQRRLADAIARESD